MKITCSMIFSLKKGDLKIRSTACVATLRLAFAGFACAAAALMLSGCAGSVPFFGEVDVMGRGAVLTQDRVDSLWREAKQIVYRYDDHRYIENDPSGGYIGGCQGEMYYVDEKLGIRTLFGGNAHFVPEGVFKITGEAPFVVARAQSGTFISFDQGREFKIIGTGSDLAVIGEIFYLGQGGGGYTLVDNFKRSTIEKARFNEKIFKDTEQLETLEISKKWWEDKDNWGRMRAEIGEIDERYLFNCVKDLPQRPPLKYERKHPNASTK